MGNSSSHNDNETCDFQNCDIKVHHKHCSKCNKLIVLQQKEYYGNSTRTYKVIMRHCDQCCKTYCHDIYGEFIDNSYITDRRQSHCYKCHKTYPTINDLNLYTHKSCDGCNKCYDQNIHIHCNTCHTIYEVGKKVCPNKNNHPQIDNNKAKKLL